jgi:hypothetical protein
MFILRRRKEQNKKIWWNYKKKINFIVEKRCESLRTITRTKKNFIFLHFTYAQKKNASINLLRMKIVIINTMSLWRFHFWLKSEIKWIIVVINVKSKWEKNCSIELATLSYSLYSFVMSMIRWCEHVDERKNFLLKFIFSSLPS